MWRRPASREGTDRVEQGNVSLAGPVEPASPPPPRRPGGFLLRIGVWLGVAALIAAAVWLELGARREREQDAIAHAAHVRALLAGPAPEWLPGDRGYRRRVWDEVRRLYARHQAQTFWIHDGAPSRPAYAFAIELARAQQDGLDPDVYGEPAIRLELTNRRAGPLAKAEQDAPLLAQLDVRLTTAFVRFVRERREGRLPETALDRDWVARRDTIDVDRALLRATRGGAARVLADLDRRDDDYHTLRQTMGDYRRLVARGGWASIASLPKVGEEDERWLALRSRLARSGDLPDSSGPPAYDAALARAIRRFQIRHGLPGDGRPGEQTLRALNVPAAERLRTLELNLERLRWLPERLPDPLVRVNVPDSHLRLIDRGVEPVAMRAVVGSPSDPTPVFADVLTFLEFHPTWSIPTSILVREMLPQFRKNRDFFFESQMRVISMEVDPPIEVDPNDVPWERAEEDSFPFIVRQDSGPDNPLGQIKFMCPNEYDVYLHDTSAPAAFTRDSRFLSHGCVRVQEPMVLAGYLLQDTKVESADSIDAILNGGAWRRIGLKRRMPVLIEYRTAWVDANGTIQFRPDVYGLDERLDEALRRGRVSDFDINPGVRRNLRARSTAEWANYEAVP